MDKIENQNQVSDVTSRLLSPDEIVFVTGGLGGAKSSTVDTSAAGSEDPDPGTCEG